jgi:hypothetical protein
MQSYRLYFIDLPTGRITSFQEFEAKNDGAAMLQADRLRGEGPIELWCQGRKLSKWPALL